MKLSRVYHPYCDWEEIDHNMWGVVDSRKKYLSKAREFTANHKLYGRFMVRVTREWPISCENASVASHRRWNVDTVLAIAHQVRRNQIVLGSLLNTDV